MKKHEEYYDDFYEGNTSDDNNGDNDGGWFGGVGTVIGVLMVLYFTGYLGGGYEGASAEDWFNEYDAEVAYSAELEEALFQANNNIEECNDAIEEAKSSTGYDYYDEPTPDGYEAMKYALEALEECEVVDEPYR